MFSNVSNENVMHETRSNQFLEWFSLDPRLQIEVLAFQNARRRLWQQQKERGWDLFVKREKAKLRREID